MSLGLEIALTVLILFICFGLAIFVIRAIFAQSDEEKLQRLAEEEAMHIKSLNRVDIWEGIDIARAKYEIPS